MNEKTFNPIELLEKAEKEITQATHELRNIIKGIETEKCIIEQKRLQFLDNLNIKSIAIFKENEAIANRTAEQLRKSVPEFVHVNIDNLEKQLKNYETQNEKLSSQLKEFSNRKNILFYSLLSSTIVLLLSVGCAILFYKYSVQSKQDVLTEYQYELERSNKVIVDKSLQDQIGYVNEWIEANPKEGNSLVEYVSKKSSNE